MFKIRWESLKVATSTRKAILPLATIISRRNWLKTQLIQTKQKSQTAGMKPTGYFKWVAEVRMHNYSRQFFSDCRKTAEKKAVCHYQYMMREAVKQFQTLDG